MRSRTAVDPLPTTQHRPNQTMALNKCIEARSAHAVRDLAPRVGRLSGCGIRTIALIFDPWRGQQTSLSNNSRWMRCAITPVGVDRATVRVGHAEHDRALCIGCASVSSPVCRFMRHSG